MENSYGSANTSDDLDLDLNSVRSRITSLSSDSLDLSTDLLSMLSPMPQPAELKLAPPTDGLVSEANVPTELVHLTRAVELADEVVLELAKSAPIEF